MSIADPRVVMRATLARYLQASMPDVKVSENWPTPGKKIVMPAATVLASQNVRTLYHPPRLWRTIPDPTGAPTGRALYSYGKAYINIQLDVWESFEARRDLLSARVTDLINRDPNDTLGTGNGVQDYRTKPGLVLRMDDYYGTFCKYMIEAIASELPESSDAAQTGEWRQAFSGQAILYLCNEEQVAILKTAVASLDLNGSTDSSSVI